MVRGFSLIELLVSLAIAATLVALVGPLGYRSVERAQLQTEMVALKRWLDRQGHDAFIAGSQVQILWLDEKTLAAHHGNANIQTRHLDHLRGVADASEVIYFSSSGIPSRPFIDLRDTKGRPLKVTLAGALSVRSGY
jgi:prepilin-type N-terminal cleavage/methylation domain-containing protein